MQHKPSPKLRTCDPAPSGGAEGGEHGVDRRELRGVPGRVVGAAVAPPVPAAPGVERPEPALGGLRVEHDDAIRVGPAVVTGLAGECAADEPDALAAAVKGDVNAAGLARGPV